MRIGRQPKLFVESEANIPVISISERLGVHYELTEKNHSNSKLEDTHPGISNGRDEPN